MLCPSGNFKTQKHSIRRIEDTEGLLAILRTNLNVNKSPFHVLRSPLRHILTLGSFDPTICPTRKSVLNTLHPYEVIDDCEENNDSDIQISRFPLVARLPQPRGIVCRNQNRIIL